MTLLITGFLGPPCTVNLLWSEHSKIWSFCFLVREFLQHLLVKMQPPWRMRIHQEVLVNGWVFMCGIYQHSSAVHYTTDIPGLLPTLGLTVPSRSLTASLPLKSYQLPKPNGKVVVFQPSWLSGVNSLLNFRGCIYTKPHLRGSNLRLFWNVSMIQVLVKFLWMEVTWRISRSAHCVDALDMWDRSYSPAPVGSWRYSNLVNLVKENGVLVDPCWNVLLSCCVFESWDFRFQHNPIHFWTFHLMPHVLKIFDIDLRQVFLFWLYKLTWYVHTMLFMLNICLLEGGKLYYCQQGKII